MATWHLETVTYPVISGSGSVSATSWTEDDGTPMGVAFIRLTATPARGYKFDRWEIKTTTYYKDGTTHVLGGTSYVNPRTCNVHGWLDEESTTLQAQTVEYGAVFIPSGSPSSGTPEYTVYTVAAPSGCGTTSGAGTYAGGQSCTITATPAAGYRFTGWTSSARQTASTAAHTFTVTEDVVWTAHFTRLRVWVTAETAPYDYEISGDVYVNPYALPKNLQQCGYGAAGDSVRLLAAPAAGWRFVEWRGPGESRFNSPEVTISLTDRNWVENSTAGLLMHGSLEGLRYIAVFEPTEFWTLKLSIVEGGAFGTLRKPVGWSGHRVGEPSHVQVVTDTDTEYEARIPRGVMPDWEEYSGDYPVVMPKTSHGRHVYKYVVQMNGDSTTRVAHPYMPPGVDPIVIEGYPGYFMDKGYDAELLDGDLNLWHASDNGLALGVEFYITRIATGKLLCTSAGAMLCGSSGALMYDG